MSKQYNLSTTEDNGQSVTTSETVTEHPEEILRLMKLAGLENAQVVAEDDSVFEPTPANDKLDLDDYSKKSPESIAKQKKTIQPTLGDNPLEYSLDENEIQEALMKEFDESEEVTEAQSPAQKAAFAKMLAAKNGKKDDTVEEKEETTVEENKKLKEDCSCGHGSDNENNTENNMEQDRMAQLAGIERKSQISEDWETDHVLHHLKDVYFDDARPGDDHDKELNIVQTYRRKSDSQLAVVIGRIEGAIDELDNAIQYRKENSTAFFMNRSDVLSDSEPRRVAIGGLMGIKQKLEDIHSEWDKNTEYEPEFRRK